MIAQTGKVLPPRSNLATAASFAVVVFAGMAVRTPLAVHHPYVALLAFLWITSDAMMLALVARSRGRPRLYAAVGVMAGAASITWLGSPPTIRETLREMPVVAAGMVIAILAHVGWGAIRARHELRAPDRQAKERWIAAISQILPPRLVRLAAAEIAVIHMALFRWSGAPDMEPNARPFAYHKHLTPICVTLLVLSAIEMGAYHLLVGHWSRFWSGVMFVLSDVGFLYLIGLIKSFRFKPVLLTHDGIRIRSGFLIDQFIPFHAISGAGGAFTGEDIRDPATLNAALLAWPNILVRLNLPLPYRSPWKRRTSFNAVAFRLDDPEPFLRLLQWRLGHTPPSRSRFIQG